MVLSALFPQLLLCLCSPILLPIFQIIWPLFALLRALCHPKLIIKVWNSLWLAHLGQQWRIKRCILIDWFRLVSSWFVFFVFLCSAPYHYLVTCHACAMQPTKVMQCENREFGEMTRPWGLNWGNRPFWIDWRYPVDLNRTLQVVIPYQVKISVDWWQFGSFLRDSNRNTQSWQVLHVLYIN